MKKRILVIGATTRPGRMSKPLMSWLQTELQSLSSSLEFSSIDLEKLNLPFLDEPNSPMQHEYTRDHTKRWSKTVSAADGFIIVTPEYNAGYPAPIKNAIDFLYDEWAGKPIAFVGYGGGPADNAIKQLKEVTERIKMKNINAAVTIPKVWKAFDEKKNVRPEAIIGSLDEVVAELEKELT